MHVNSLGYRTDLIFARHDGTVTDRGDYLVVRTPSNPGFHWGNFLLFGRAPRAGDALEWFELFEQEIESKQPTHHIAIGWDASERGEVDGFITRGMSVECDTVMSASALTPPPFLNTQVEVRALREDAEWEAATALQLQMREPCYGLKGYTQFKSAQMARYRAMSRLGLGDWYGAFLGGELVADMGIFHDGAGLARYQSVETRSDHQRQGICARLLLESAALAREHHPTIQAFVIVAKAGSQAARLYGSAGFSMSERQWGMHWWKVKT